MYDGNIRYRIIPYYTHNHFNGFPEASDGTDGGGYHELDVY